MPSSQRTHPFAKNASRGEKDENKKGYPGTGMDGRELTLHTASLGSWDSDRQEWILPKAWPLKDGDAAGEAEEQREG